MSDLVEKLERLTACDPLDVEAYAKIGEIVWLNASTILTALRSNHDDVVEK